MQNHIKQVLDKEFNANSIDIVSRVEPHAWQSNRVISYRITLLYAGSRKVMDIYSNVQRPFTPKVYPLNSIEPHKLINLCEIIIEAFNELERKTEEGEDQFR